MLNLQPELSAPVLTLLLLLIVGVVLLVALITQIFDKMNEMVPPADLREGKSYWWWLWKAMQGKVKGDRL